MLSCFLTFHSLVAASQVIVSSIHSHYVNRLYIWMPFHPVNAFNSPICAIIYNTCPVLNVCKFIRNHLNFPSSNRHPYFLAMQMSVPFVIRMHRNANAAPYKLRPCCCKYNFLACINSLGLNVHKMRLPFSILKLNLGNCSLACWAEHYRAFLPLNPSFLVKVQEAFLAYSLAM